MRGVRSFIILLIIAVPLGWYALRESKRAPADDKKPSEKVFADLKADAIDQVTVTSESGERTTAEKKGGKWQLTRPSPGAADEAELSGITSNLASLEIQRVVDDQPTDLKQYGLDPARVSIAFRGNGHERTLLVGQKTPSASDLYARLPDKPRVFLIPAYLDTTFNRTTFDLRDKAVLTFDREKVDHLQIETPDHVVNVSKLGNDWRITSPIDARADFGSIEGILGKLNTAQMKSLVDAAGKDPKAFGLDKPAATVRVSSGSAQAALAIGKAAAEGTVYARDLSRPMIFTVESTLLDDVKKAPADYRVKDLFDARAFNTTRIEAVRGGQTFTFEKQGEKFKQLSPSAKDADAGKVEALVTALSNARAASFVDKTAGTGLDKPDLVVSLTFEENKHEKVSFGRAGADVYAQRDGEAGAAKIDASSYDAILKALDALK